MVDETLDPKIRDLMNLSYVGNPHEQVLRDPYRWMRQNKD